MTTRIRFSDKYKTCREGLNINVVGWLFRAVRSLWTGAHPGISKLGAAIGQRNLGDPGLSEMSALRMRGKVQAGDDFVGGQIHERSLLPSAISVKTCSPDCLLD